MKSKVFQLANSLRKTGLSLSEAVKRAWATIKLRAQMLVAPVSFFYTKDDGTERFAVGYFGAAPASNKPEPTSSPAALAIRYYDTLAGGWRSFRADRLIVA